jgi:hypothetical protein
VLCSKLGAAAADGAGKGAPAKGLGEKNVASVAASQRAKRALDEGEPWTDWGSVQI